MITYKKFLQNISESPIYDPAYHGSSKSSLEFTEPKTGKATGKAKQQLDFGTHFTQDEDYAKRYAKGKGGRVYKGSVELKRPLDLTKGIWHKDDQDFESVHSLSKTLKLKNSVWHVDENGNKTKNPHFVTISTQHLDSKPPATVHSTLIQHGYDGVIYNPYKPTGYSSYYEKHPKSYVALHKNQLNLK